MLVLLAVLARKANANPNPGSDVKASLGSSEALLLTCNSERSITDYATMPDEIPSGSAPLCGSESTVAMVTLAQQQKTFATSNYKRVYDAAQAPAFQHYLLGAVNNMLKLYAKRTNPTLQQPALGKYVDEYMGQIQDDAFKDDAALRHDVAALAQYLWTSAKTHRVVQFRQLCSVLNAVIRDDIEEEVQAAAIFFRGINTRRVTRVRSGNVDPSFPRNGETWRGGGFRSQHRAFFEGMVGRKYRVPGFLATSAKRCIAAKFAFDAFDEDSSHPCVIWHVTVDPRGKTHPEYRVKHMAFVSKTLVEGEEEYLFAPYSVFTLVCTQWSDSLRKPHEFTVRAAHDNKIEDEKLPLTPWY